MKMVDLKYTRSGLMLAVDSYFYDDFIYFWKHDEEKDKITKAYLSQWYPSIFIIDGVTYNCAEQYMMAEKARIFGDEAIRAKILATSDPSAHLITRTVYSPSELKSLRIMDENSAVCELISGSPDWRPGFQSIYKVAPSLYELKDKLEDHLC